LHIKHALGPFLKIMRLLSVNKKNKIRTKTLKICVTMTKFASFALGKLIKVSNT